MWYVKLRSLSITTPRSDSYSGTPYINSVPRKHRRTSWTIACLSILILQHLWLETGNCQTWDHWCRASRQPWKQDISSVEFTSVYSFISSAYSLHLTYALKLSARSSRRFWNCHIFTARSVRLSVRLSHACIASKRLHVARCSLNCQIAKCVYFGKKIFPRDDHFPCNLGSDWPTSPTPSKKQWVLTRFAL